MQYPYGIRTATINDLPAVMTIEQQSFDEETRENEETFRRRIAAFPEGFLVMTASDAEVVGYCCGELWNTIPGAAEPEGVTATDLAAHFSLGHDASRSHVAGGTVLYISSIALLPKTRGQGMGKTFLAECLNQILETAPQVETIELLVNEQWPAARHIYESMGFMESGRIAGFFHDGDGIMMKRGR